MTEILKVATPSHEYPIFFADSIEKLLLEKIRNYVSNQVVIITNTTVAPLYLKQVERVFAQLNIPFISVVLADGESYKNIETLYQIYDALLTNNIERTATLVALGGGVIGDMVGFAAATYQRGVPFIQIPTTLLSQVDSSVGGKTAINHPLGKNMIGAFYQPQAVFIAKKVLRTLPDREFSAGMAEVVKYALLGDIEFFVWLETNIDAVMQQDPDAVAYILYKCCQMKAEIVGQDEKETAQRALLNLGHTFGHVIEVEMGYGNWLHGEAVAVGLILACKLSYFLGNLTESDVIRVENLLKKIKLPVKAPNIEVSTWLKMMQHDKKVKNGKIRFITLEALGQAVVNSSISEQDLKILLTT